VRSQREFVRRDAPKAKTKSAITTDYTLYSSWETDAAANPPSAAIATVIVFHSSQNRLQLLIYYFYEL